ncbi:MAG: CCA tRNA nucleotidyltransferase [Alphaproteobacteria bacterium]|nr:MAG: CCA tRNA nucleotidyltransferase [Alphaproteobacteria bacterium]
MVFWLKNPNLEKLMHTLQDCMVVGGCVRNYLFCLENNLPFDKFLGEIDLATSLLPEEVMQLSKQAGFKVIPTGLQHGTVTCVMDKDVFEVTTLRVDLETDGRHATVAFSKSWEEDAKRRDLTINALYADINGKIYDFVNGLDDLKTGSVRFIGDPNLRIQEDYLRILRFFRFFAHYGKHYDEKSFEACRKHVTQLKHIARERCIAELLKLLDADNVVTALKMMDEIDLWDYCDFPRVDLNVLQKAIQVAKNLGLHLSNIGKLSTFYGDFSKLKISNEQSKRITLLRNLKPMSQKSDYIKWINTVPKELWDDGIILKGTLGDISFLDQWKQNLFYFSGTDVMSIMGIETGPRVKFYLDKLLDQFCESETPSSHQELADFLNTLK